jgi:hypothetical protein
MSLEHNNDMTRGNRRSGPRIIALEKYSPPPPLVLCVIESPLIQNSTLTSLLETISTTRGLRDMFNSGMEKLLSGKGGYDESLARLANMLLKTRSSIVFSILLATYMLPRNTMEAGSFHKFFLKLVTSLGILYSMGHVEQSKILLKLASLELETLQIARRIFTGRDELARLASYVGDDIALLMKEYRSGNSDLKTVIEEIIRIITYEIEFAKSCLLKLPKSKTSEKLLKELNTEMEVLEKEVHAQIYSS